MSSKSFNIALVLTAYDKATRVINETTRNAEKRMRELKNKSMESFAVGAAQIGAGLAVAAPLKIATDAAIGFEDKMADVAKVMNLTVGSGDFLKMGGEAKSLAIYLGKSGEEAADLMAALAQGGVEKENIREVGKIAGEMGVAFDMASGLAGDSFMKIKNALGQTIPETKKVADAINHLSDKMASKASEIVNFMASGGSSVAASFKIAGKDVAAFGSELISMGKSSSEAATIMERFAKGIFKNDALRKEFDKAGGGSAGLVAILEKANKTKTGAFDFFQGNKFGEYSSDFALLAKNIDQVKTALSYVGKEQNYVNSVTKEFNNRNSTTQGKLNQLKASWDVLKITLGEAFLPTVQKVANAMKKVVDWITKWTQENPRLAKTLGFAAAAVSGMLLLAGAINIMKGAWIAMRVAMMTNPVGLILMAIAVIASVIIANWDKIGPFFSRLWARVKAICAAAWNWLKANIMYILNPASLIYKHWEPIVAFFSKVWDKVKNVFSTFWEWIKSLPAKFFEAGVNIVNAIGDGIKSAANKAIDQVKKLAKDIRDFFPFSPAKRGPLMDIHKVRLVETLAANIKPGPMVSAVNGLARSTMGALNAPQMGSISMAGAGGGSFNYSPTINISGAGPQAKLEFSKLLKEHKDEIMRLIKGETERSSRRSY